MDPNKIREDFPLLKKRKVIYFDNACMSLKSQQVIDAVNAYYTEYSGCAGRSLHKIGKETEEHFEGARAKIAKFIGADAKEVVFSKNTTESINLVARCLDFSKRSKVVTSNMEHHSALLPFQMLAKQKEISLDFVYADKEGITNIEGWKEKIGRQTRLVVVHHTTNAVGTRAPLKEIVKIAHDAGALVLVDGAQGVPHAPVNFRKEGYDFLAFSGHKMLGPTGTGCLVARSSLLEEMPPFIVGGETIEKVTLDSVVFAKPPHKFEGGLQHYAGFIGLGAAADYLNKIGMQDVERHEKELAKEIITEIAGISKVQLLGPSDSSKRAAIATFNIQGMAAHQVAIMLDSLAGIAVRSGVFCAEPAMTWMGAPQGAVRASLYVYNTKEEISVFSETLSKIAKTAR
jgi:cysteine desulfurase/selenocysteine lyase